MMTKREGKKRKSDQDGTGTTIVSAEGDIDQEVVHETGSAVIDTEIAHDRVRDDGMTTETTGADIGREVTTTSGAKSVLTVEESES